MDPDRPSRAAPETGSVSELIPQLRAGQASVPGAAAEMKPRVRWVQSGPQDTHVPFLSPLRHTCASSDPVSPERGGRCGPAAQAALSRKQGSWEGQVGV